MSKLTHEEEFRRALERIVSLGLGAPGSHSDGVVRGRMIEVAQAALANAKAADETLIDIQNGHIALQHT